MVNDIVPRRSALFMPASNARALEKAKTLACDTVIFDLEDAVSAEAKPNARSAALKAVNSREYGARELVVRINGLDTPWWQDDIAAFKNSQADAILIPKVDNAVDIEKALTALGRSQMPLWAMIETPRGVLNSARICEVSEQLTGLVVGPNDLTKELHAKRTVGRINIQTALQMILLAGRAFGKVVLDGVFNDFRDDAGFRAECAAAADMGFDGKTLIHPSQIEGANRAFSPSEQAIEKARRIVDAFHEVQQAGLGVADLDGVMIEELHVKEAESLIMLAQAIDARG